MKTMKKVISTVLLLCMLAALLSVSAFATGLPTEISIQRDYITKNGDETTATIPVAIRLGGEAIGRACEVEWWVTNNDNPYGLRVYGEGVDSSKSTDNRRCSVPLIAGSNQITVKLLVDGAVSKTDSHTITKNLVTPSPDPIVPTRVLSLDKTWFEMTSVTEPITALVDGVAVAPEQIDWVSDDHGVASVANGVITANGPGTTTIRAYLKGDSSVLPASCTVVVKGSINVKIVPIDTDLKKGVSYQIVASVDGTNARFDYWRVEGGQESYVRIGSSNSARTTLTPQAVSSAPIRLYAHASDGRGSYAETYIEFTISESAGLRIEAYPNYITSGLSTAIEVVNAEPGETFTWNVVPTNSNLIASRETQSLSSKLVLVAGIGEGTADVTATSSYGRKANITIYFNMEPSRGLAKVNPASTTWTAGQGNLTFEVYPFFYSATIDGKPLTAQSGYYTYYNGVLTIKPALLSQLSAGEHTLKINTSTGNGTDGLVYATIRVNGTASSVYGDNAHVRGSNYNLYFNSTDAVRGVEINNQWIDPANYTLDNAGKRLTLHSDFLNKLGYGSYTMKLSTQNGYTETANFRIVTANYAPATGDDSNLGAWMMLMVISGAGAVALIPRKKKSCDIAG